MIEKTEEIINIGETNIKIIRIEDLMIDMRWKKSEDKNVRLTDSWEGNSKDKQKRITSLKKRKWERITRKGQITAIKDKTNNTEKLRKIGTTEIEEKIEATMITGNKEITDNTKITETLIREVEDENSDNH